MKFLKVIQPCWIAVIMLLCTVLCHDRVQASKECQCADFESTQATLEDLLQKLDARERQLSEMVDKQATLDEQRERQLSEMVDKQATLDEQRERHMTMVQQRLETKEKALDGALLQANQMLSFQGDTERRSRDKREVMEGNVAFYVRLGNRAMHAAVDSTLMFENVVTNIGGAYDTRSGLFSVPVTGVYVFGVTLMTDPGHFSRYAVAKNGNSIIPVVSDASDATYSTSSQSFILYLQQGDTISVQFDLDDEGFAHGDNHCTFSGFLQAPDIDSAPISVGK